MISRSSLASMILAGVVGGPLVCQLLDRSMPYALSDGYSVPQVITPGQPYILRQKLINYPRTCAGVIYRQLVDSEGKIFVEPPLPDAYGFIDEAVREGPVIGWPRILSPQAALGPALITVTVDFKCNWVQNFVPLRTKFVPIKVMIGVATE